VKLLFAFGDRLPFRILSLWPFHFSFFGPIRRSTENQIFLKNFTSNMSEKFPFQNSNFPRDFPPKEEGHQLSFLSSFPKPLFSREKKIQT
jgi:hypothetical protein